MFGQNEIVGRKYFTESPEAQAGKLLVTSIFFTLQGEGPLRGEPAVFVRLAKCNLACAFCDTFFDAGEWLLPTEIEAEVERQIRTYFGGTVPEWAQFLPGYRMPDDKDVEDVPVNRGWAQIAGQLWVQARKRKLAFVVTGGEPMLQTNLSALIAEIGLNYNKVQIETNGTLLVNLPGDTIIVCSPKCGGKGAGHYLKPALDLLARADCLKFVMEAKRGCECPPGECRSSGYADDECPASPYSEIPVWAHEWHRETGKPIFISPMNVYLKQPDGGTVATNATQRQRAQSEVVSFWTEGLIDRAAVQRNHEYAAQYCLRHGFIFNMQQHLFASLA